MSGPPAQITVASCHRALARRLAVAPHPDLATGELLEDLLSKPGGPARIVLLFDEFDGYADMGDGRIGDKPGRRFFNDLETARRELDGLSIVAAGNIGVFVFRDVLGSDFLSRADRVVLNPFGEAEIRQLAEPFEHEQTALRDEILDAVLLASGGNPALVTFAFQELWEAHTVDTLVVAAAYGRFQQQKRGVSRKCTTVLCPDGFVGGRRESPGVGAVQQRTHSPCRARGRLRGRRRRARAQSHRCARLAKSNRPGPGHGQFQGRRSG